MLFWNLFLAATWCLLWQSTHVFHVVSGLVLAFVVLRFHKPDYGRVKPLSLLQFLWYAIRFLKELLMANIQVAKVVLTPGLRIKPGIVKYRLDITSDAGKTLLANSITLTPGTLTMEVSEDEQHLYIHALEVDDPRQVEEDIKKSLERPAMKVLA